VRLPIRVRLTAWYGLFGAGLLLALGAFLVLRLRSDLRSTVDREVRGSAATIKRTYLAEGATGFHEISAAALVRGPAYAQVLGPRGSVIASSSGDVALDPMVPASNRPGVLAGSSRLFDANLGDAPQPFRVLAVPVTKGGRRQMVVVAESLQRVDQAVRRILVLLLIAGPIAMAAAAFGGWLLVRNALAPVDRMRRKAEQIGIDQLHERLAAANPHDEIGHLASTLNAMLDRLESGVTANRQLVADASHELRTPLAAMRAELDVSIRDRNRTEAERTALASVREDVDRMSHTVENLLTLAQAAEGQLELVREQVSLQETVVAAAEPLRPLAQRKQVQLRIAGEPSRTEGDSSRLRQALTNLIENAIEFTPPGGEVTVSSWANGNQAGVTVTDTGVGIPSDAREHVFERFYRVDPSRSRASGGSGLGLAICKEIAIAHGGTISVQSTEGEGSSFTLTLPANGPVPAKAATAPAGGK
jgi:heavy metal sensor kinase